jgi:hypothetical protein
MSESNVQLIDINKVKQNKNNPRLIRDEKYLDLLESITESPSMMSLREVVLDKDYVIQGGNQRHKACKELGWKQIPYKMYTEEMYKQDLAARRAAAKKKNEKYIKESYEDLCKEFVIKDNGSYGEMDWKVAREGGWKIEKMEKWGQDVPDFGNHERLEEVNSEDGEWVGMPEFSAKNPSKKIIIHFETEEDREAFTKEYKMKFTQKQANAWSTNYPFKDRDDLSSVKFEKDEK